MISSTLLTQIFCKIFINFVQSRSLYVLDSCSIAQGSIGRTRKRFTIFNSPEDVDIEVLPLLSWTTCISLVGHPFRDKHHVM